MSQTERLLAILDRLCQQRRQVNVAWIANTFEVSDRQARRDLEYIRDRIVDTSFGSNVSLEYDRAKNEYKLVGSAKELESMAAKSVIASAVAMSAMDPLREILGEKTKESTSDKVRFISQAAELPDYKTFIEILHAIEDNIRLKISYSNVKRDHSTRIIEPLELVNYTAIWYVKAYDLEKQMVLTLSLSRIGDITRLEEKRTFNDFERLKEEALSGYGIYSGRKIYQYTMRFYNDVAWIVSNQIWHKEQEGHWIDENTYELTVPAAYYRELLAKTLSFGASAEPISPPYFVNKYYEELDLLIARVNKRKKEIESD